MEKESEEFIVHGPKPLTPILNVSLGRLYFDKLSKCGDKHQADIVDVHTSKTLTYKSLFNSTRILADYLQENGYGKDTVISICSGNSLEFPVVVVSCLYLGSILAPINPNYTENELRHVLQISKPKIVFCTEANFKKFQVLRKEFRFIEKIILMEYSGRIRGVLSLASIVNNRGQSRDSWKEFAPLDGDPAKINAYILNSSGTTGLPKGVLLSHRNILTKLAHKKDPLYYLETKNEIYLGLMPFFYGFGLFLMLTSIYLDVKLVMMKRFEEHLFLKTLQDYKISSLRVAPPLAIFLAKTPLVSEYDLSILKEIISAAAPLGKGIEEELKKRLGIHKISQAYGMTETSLAITLHRTGDPYKKGSVGKIVPYGCAKVVDPETGKSLGPNKAGELYFKGAQVMVGYYGNKKATEESITSDGWYKTGDLVYYDEDGYFYMVDRLKELIKYKGYQVAPAELEALLLNHPKIKDVGVVGKVDKNLNELPFAFVVKADGVDLTEAEVQEYVARAVSSQKKLRGGVKFIDAIPKNASGKILRRELKELLKLQKSKL